MFGWRGMKGGVKGKGGEKFNEPCLGFFFYYYFLSGREKDFMGLKEVKYSSKPLIFNSPKFKSFGGSGSTYFKKF